MDILVADLSGGNLREGNWNGKTTTSYREVYYIINGQPIHQAYVYPVTAKEVLEEAIKEYKRLEEAKMHLILDTRNKFPVPK